MQQNGYTNQKPAALASDGFAVAFLDSLAGRAIVAKTGGDMMAYRYHVTAVRRSAGIHTDEGAFDSKDAALARLDALEADRDCLLGEVEQWATHDAPQTLIVAQAERIGGEWQRISGELRPRSRGREAEALLQES